jgi:hypothetical protein
MVIRAKSNGDRDAHLASAQICLPPRENFPSPRKAGRGLGRGAAMVEPPLHEPPIEQGASSPQPSPPRVCGGEGEGTTRRVRGFNARMGSGNSLPSPPIQKLVEEREWAEVVQKKRDARSRRGGWMIAECIVALGILIAVMIPISFSFVAEHRACRASYYHAVAMELVDGEMEILRAGEWRQFPRGAQPYAINSPAAKNLPTGQFMLTVEEHLVRLEWQPGAKDQGGKVTRETILP